jgi:hypothetical protein
MNAIVRAKPGSCRFEGIAVGDAAIIRR